MKAIRVTFDEALLARLDKYALIRERSRSAVLREAAAAYLKRKDAEEIDRKYREGYANAAELDRELEEWAAQAARCD